MPVIKNLSNVFVGTVPNDGQGDLIRDAFVKVNNNFNAIYTNGQFVGHDPDSRNFPSYTWEQDKNTGMYRVGSGKIGFTLNGVDSLILDEVGTISWFGAALATQAYVTAQLGSVTGGGSGSFSGNVGGIVVVTALPTAGNYVGRTAFYNGDIWIYSNYPPGNGAGLAANPDIARAAGSDSRWVRFRGDLALPTGATRPTTAAEGSLFYQTTDKVIYLFIEGTWKTLSSVIVSNVPSGMEILPSLPPTVDVSNYEGRTVVVGSEIYIYKSGAWTNLNSYVTGGGGSGITTGTSLPGSGNAGELFRLQGTNAGLYIYSGDAWLRIETYVGGSITTGVRTLSSLPTNLTSYNAGDIIQVSNVFYILNLARNNWDLFVPGNVLANGTVTVSLSADQVDTINIKNGAVTGDKILSNTIPGTRIQLAAITADRIATNAIIGSKINPESVTTAKIAPLAIDSTRLADNSVTTTKIAVGSVTSDKIAAGAISGDKINVGLLSNLTPALGTVTSGRLQSSDGKMVIDLNSKIIRIEL